MSGFWDNMTAPKKIVGKEDQIDDLRQEVKELNSELSNLRAKVTHLSSQCRMFISEIRAYKESVSGQRIDFTNSFEAIASAVAEYTGISINAMKGKTSDRKHVRARCILYNIGYSKGFSYRFMGKFSNRDHSTVMLCIERSKKHLFENDFLFIQNQ